MLPSCQLMKLIFESMRQYLLIVCGTVIKINGPGFVYELGLSIKTGNIVWYNGPFPAKHSIF